MHLDQVAGLPFSGASFAPLKDIVFRALDIDFYQLRYQTKISTDRVNGNRRHFDKAVRPGRRDSVTLMNTAGRACANRPELHLAIVNSSGKTRNKAGFGSELVLDQIFGSNGEGIRICFNQNNSLDGGRE